MDEDLQKWLNAEISDDELKDRIGDVEARKYMQIFGEVDSWVPDNSTSILDPLEITGKPKAKSRQIRPMVNYAIAAVLALTIVSYIWLILGDSQMSFSTGVGEIRVVELPDGASSVTLSPNSEISWDEDEWDAVMESDATEPAPRLVELKGKALFQVEKGGPFTVESEIGIVEVLGTTFEVDDFEGGMHVLCFEGVVAAKPKKSKKKVTIRGGEGYRYFKNKWERKMQLKKTLPDWLQNQSKFENAPLVQVISTIEKLYGVNIDSSNVSVDKRFTGTIPNDDLDVSLEIVFAPYKIRFDKEGKEVVLSQD
ncbi:MAG: FecR domain-containing protein [Ekhidna sp.]|nr:FecR domain-containing protein [Ekhidna sp.]